MRGIHFQQETQNYREEIGVNYSIIIETVVIFTYCQTQIKYNESNEIASLYQMISLRNYTETIQHI